MFDDEDTSKKVRRALIAYTAGFIFGVGWWLFIAAAVLGYDNTFNTNRDITGEWLIGMFSTIGLMMVNALNWTDINSFSFSGDNIEFKHRAWLTASFAVLIIGLLASVWAGAQLYLVEGGDDVYLGVGLILQNLLIFISAIVFHFSKPQPQF